VKEKSDVVPVTFKLEQNYPNPFNPATTIKFALAKTTRVSLKIYNLLGELVATLIDKRIESSRHAHNHIRGAFVDQRRVFLQARNRGRGCGNAKNVARAIRPLETQKSPTDARRSGFCAQNNIRHDLHS
jgi:hypothetical protein